MSTFYWFISLAVVKIFPNSKPMLLRMYVWGSPFSGFLLSKLRGLSFHNVRKGCLLTTGWGSLDTDRQWTVGGRAVHSSLMRAALFLAWSPGNHLTSDTCYILNFRMKISYLFSYLPASKQITFYPCKSNTDLLNKIWKIPIWQ